MSSFQTYKLKGDMHHEIVKEHIDKVCLLRIGKSLMHVDAQIGECQPLPNDKRRMHDEDMVGEI